MNRVPVPAWRPSVARLGAAALLLAAAAMVALWTGLSGGDPAVTTPETLPDSTVLGRVNDRVIRVYDFRSQYFRSDAQTRPAPDSAGRVQFLNTLIDKEVLALTARGLDRPMGFEDRVDLREFTNSALARTIYQRRVTDHVSVTEKDLRAIYPQFGYSLRLRYLLFGDPSVARGVRADVVRGRMTWKDAARHHSLGPDSLAEGDLGWVMRSEMSGVPAIKVFALRPAEISNVIEDQDGLRVWQCLDRRPSTQPPFVAVRRSLLIDVVAARTAPLREKFFQEMRVRAGASYDTTNIRWLVGMFRAANPPVASLAPVSIDLRNLIPQITPADTGRVLAIAEGRPLTVGQFRAYYASVPSILRSKVSTFASLFSVAEKMVLEPVVVAAARDQGLERDPQLLAEVDAHREGLLVQHLYDDSVMSRVRVTEAQRQKYFDEHRNEFMTREKVRYATIPRPTDAGADSVIARLRGGESAGAIIEADSMRGRRDVIRELFRDQPNAFTQVLFEELHPGQATRVGPGSDGWWAVLHVLSHDFPRQMPYPEAQRLVDESAQNAEAERQLHVLLGRLRSKYRLESHPELVMRIALRTVGADWNLPPGD